MRSTRGTRLQGARQFRSFKTQVWRFSFQRVTVKKAFQSTEESELPACKSERAGHGQHWPSFIFSGGLVKWLVTSYKATPRMIVKRASKEGWREKFTHLNKAFTSFEPIVFTGEDSWKNCQFASVSGMLPEETIWGALWNGGEGVGNFPLLNTFESLASLVLQQLWPDPGTADLIRETSVYILPGKAALTRIVFKSYTFW